MLDPASFFGRLAYPRIESEAINMQRSPAASNHMSIDLHGYSVKDAKNYIRVSLEEARQRNSESMTVITGIGNHRNQNGTRGVLFNAFPKWLKKMPELASVVSDCKQDMGGYKLIFNTNPTLKEHCEKLSSEMKEIVEGTHSESLLREMEEKAKQGDTISLAIIGSMKLHGIYLEKDVETGVSYLEKAALKETSVMIQLGALYASIEFSKHEYAKARYWYQEADKKNDPEAAFRLGSMYWLGEGIIKNDKVALGFLKKAADNKHYHAAFNVAEILFHGIGEITKDVDSAIAYYKIAAAGGVVAAQRNLGMMLLTGKETDQDLSGAFKWFSLAAEQKNPESCYFMGFCYETGSGVKEDPIKACVWYRKSANLGDLDAKFKIAKTQIIGTTYFPKNVSEAVSTLRELARQNHVDSLYLLGIHLLNDPSIEIQNEGKYFLYCAAIAKYPEAIENIIQLYLSGDYHENSEQIIQWLSNSVENISSYDLYQRIILLKPEHNISDELINNWHNVLESRSQRNEIDALAALGHIFLIGFYKIKKDEKLAFSKLKQIEFSDHNEGLCSLGYCYLEGIGTKINLKKAKECFSKSAKLGNKIARRNYISFIRENDDFSDEDLFFLESAAEDNEVEIQIFAAQLYLQHPSGNFFLSGIYWLYQAAQLGDEGALNFFRESIKAKHQKATHEMLCQVYLHRHNTKEYPKIAGLNINPDSTSTYYDVMKQIGVLTVKKEKNPLTHIENSNDSTVEPLKIVESSAEKSNQHDEQKKILKRK